MQRNGPFSATNVAIPFDVERVNLGKAMELTFFRAPRKGTYFFSFSGLASFPETTSPDRAHLGIGLYMVGISIGRVQTEESNSVANQFSPLSLQLTLDLEQDANIWLQIDIMSSGLFCMTTQLVKEVAIGPISPVGCWKRKSSRRHLCEFW